MPDWRGVVVLVCGLAGAKTLVYHAVDLTMKVHNLDYAQLVSNQPLLHSFAGAMESALSRAVDETVGPLDTLLSLQSGQGLVEVNWNIVPPPGVDIDEVLEALERSSTQEILRSAVQGVPGIAKASTGNEENLDTELLEPIRSMSERQVQEHKSTETAATLIDWEVYLRNGHLQNCNQSDFRLGEVDTGSEALVWLVYIGYMMLVCLLAFSSHLCCSCMMGHASKRAVVVPSGPGTKDVKTGQGSDDELLVLAPNVDKAEEHLVFTSPTVRGKWRSVLSTTINQMSEIGGNGTELYFRLLMHLGFTFFIMAGLTAPTAVIGYVGDFAPDIGGAIAKTTIGNLGLLEAGGLEEQAARLLNVPFMGCTLFNASTITRFFGWFDFGAALVFLSVITVFRFILVPQTVRISDRESITCRDYTVEVGGLPPEVEDMTQYERLLTEHFLGRLRVIEENRIRNRERLKRGAKLTKINRLAREDEIVPPPQVEEVVLVRNYNGRLKDIKNRAELKKQLGISEYKQDTKKCAKLQRKIDALTTKLEEHLKKEHELPVVKAYVTINAPSHARALLHHYRFSTNWLFWRCQWRNKRFLDNPIRVRKAPEPSNIIWENQDVSSCSLTVRKILTNVTFLLLIFLSMALIYVTLVGTRDKTSASTHNFLGDDSCDPVFRGSTEGGFKCMVSAAKNWTRAEAEESQEKLECYCLTQGYTSILLDSDIFSTCTPWIKDVAYQVGITGLASVVVVLINLILQVVLVWLAVFERSSSVSGKDTSIMMKIAVAQTLNTGFVPLLVNFNLPDSVRNVIVAVPGLQFVGRGDYQDFVRGWYTVVGLSLLVNMLANACMPAFQNLSFYLFTGLRRWVCTREQFLQRYAQVELLELYTNPAFDMSIRYAGLLMTVFVTMIYSSGLPLLNLLAAAYCFLMFWVDKFVLLRGSRRPPFYDTQMPEQAAKAMMYAAPLHCLFAVLMFGQPCTFPSNPLGGTLGSLSAASANSTMSLAGAGAFNERISRESTWMIFGLLLVFLAVWVVWTVLWALALDALVRYVGKNLCGCGKQKMDDHFEHMRWETAKAHIEKEYPPASFRIEESVGFRRLAPYLQSGSHTDSKGFTGFSRSQSSWNGSGVLRETGRADLRPEESQGEIGEPAEGILRMAGGSDDHDLLLEDPEHRYTAAGAEVQ